MLTLLEAPRGPGQRRRHTYVIVSPFLCKDICDHMYGNRNVARAATTAPSLDASSEKNQMPGRPCSSRTYVRTLVSQNRDAHGSDGVCSSRTRMLNGMSPTHALPSNVSSVSRGGSNRATTSGLYVQCRKVSVSHRCNMTARRTSTVQSGPYVSV